MVQWPEAADQPKETRRRPMETANGSGAAAGWHTALELDVLPFVDKPARYTGGEWNIVLKDWDSVDLRFVVSYPDTYELGMSNLAIQIVYDMVNRRPDALCERVFCPWIDMEAKMREHGVPLYGLES